MASDNYSDGSMQGYRLHTPIRALNSLGNEEHLMLTNQHSGMHTIFQYLCSQIIVALKKSYGK